MEYRIVEKNKKFSIQAEVVKKNIFGKEKTKWVDVDKDGNPFVYMRVGIFSKVDNWDSILQPMNTIEEVREKKEMFESGETIYY